MNTLVLRTEVGGELRVRELLQRVREVCLGAYGHQEVPFEMLVEELQPERNISHTPLFQVMFTLQTNLQTAARGAATATANDNLMVSAMGTSSGTAKFDLLLVMTEVQGMLSGQLEYNTDLYEQATISRLAAHYGQLLVGLVARRETALGVVVADGGRARTSAGGMEPDGAGVSRGSGSGGVV